MSNTYLKQQTEDINRPNDNDCWDRWYQHAKERLKYNDVLGAFEDAVVCRELIAKKYRMAEMAEKISAIEKLAPTVFLFVECCKKNGCNQCAEKQLLEGQWIVEKILHNNSLPSMLREKAREILKKIFNKLFILYRETGQMYELALLKSKHTKSYFHLYSV